MPLNSARGSESHVKILTTVLQLTLVMIAFVALGSSALGQDREKRVTAKDMPPIVIANFKRAYPKATIRGYVSEIENGKQYYEIESREGAMQRDVLYNADGSVAEIEEVIDASALPRAALQAIRQSHPRAVITLTEKTVAGDKITYEVHAREGRKRFAMEFDSDGKLLSKGK